MSASSLLVTCGIMTQLRCRFAPEIFLMRDSGSFDRAELGEVDLGPRQEAQRGAVGRTAGDGGRSGQRLLDEGAHVVGRDAVLGPEP